MKLLIVPKPVLNDDIEVEAYCFRYKRANEIVTDQPSRAFDGAMSSPCFDVLNMVGLNAFTNGLPIFIPMSKVSLLMDIENRCAAPPEMVIFMLNEQTLPDEPFLDGIRRLKALGYRFALENVTDYDALHPLFALCDFLLLDSTMPNAGEVLRVVQKRFLQMVCIATNVADTQQFRKMQHSRFHHYEGNFYSVPVLKNYNTLAPVKVNSIQLMNLVRDDDFEIDQVAKIVGQDPSLSISLLRLANSAIAGGSKIKTIQHAVAMLGQKEVRKWVTTAVSGSLASDKPDEITKLSLMRAKFAENLAPQFEMAIHAPSLFLMGLFSILDAVLEMPMEQALKIVTVTDRIASALVSGTGEFAIVLQFVRNYEAANWNEVSRLMVLCGLEAEDVFSAYIEAARWYGNVMDVDLDADDDDDDDSQESFQ